MEMRKSWTEWYRTYKTWGAGNTVLRGKVIALFLAMNHDAMAYL